MTVIKSYVFNFELRYNFNYYYITSLKNLMYVENIFF